MFDKEGFIADYVEAVRTNNAEKQQEVLERLTPAEDFDFRKELVEGIIAQVKELEGDYSAHQEFLSVQLQLLEAAKLQEQQKQDSASEEGKDNSAPEEATQDVAADTSADETVERNDSDVEKAVESGGYAPTTEAEEGKS